MCLSTQQYAINLKDTSYCLKDCYNISIGGKQCPHVNPPYGGKTLWSSSQTDEPLIHYFLLLWQ
ncbi:hypothetical protein BOW86_gp087 [Synechococcus phage S-CAM7]|uniref:Uncharacterized protein n=1 Tax=Synechococcus phage S-CAM7 TaxID=1883368 RepID=A0A1D8KTP3_9CAUD|nr:hypothetical protein BOW86_gp087 [Synechococcus phage S-CAM7]AOV62011.1 hypothetical protein C490910_087 [Synechococcus phage S-CAM7]